MSSLKSKIPVILILAIAVLGQIPLISLLTSPPAGYTSLGGSPLLSPSDINVYLGAMKEGQLGHWLYTNNYTTIDHAKILVFSLYILLGHVSKWTGVAPSIVFILAQFFSAILLLNSIWLLGSSFFSRKKQRLLYFFVALFVTGYGWMILLLINAVPFLNFAKSICSGRCFSIDLWTHDATVFPLLSTVPHITLTAALMVFSVLAAANYLRSHDKKSAFFLILLPTLIGLLSAYHLLIIFAFNSLIIITNLKKLKKYRALIFSTILVLARVLYLSFGLNAHASFSNWIKASHVYSPPFPSFLIGWGGLFLAGYFGLSRLPKTKLSSLVKMISSLALVFAIFPSSIARNFVLTTPIFLAIFATFGLASLSFKKNFSKIIVILTILATIDSFFIYTSAFSINKQLKNDPSFGLFFLANPEKEGLDWLGANSKEDEGVITTYRLGDIIPAYTGNKVFWGHWSLSGRSENQYRYGWVIEAKNQDEVLGFLRSNNLNWLITPANINLHQRYLKQEFSNSVLSIYKIETPQ
ncbi:MAG: hypothetical protein Q8P25_01310 [Candidatus Curtissbacteria bacterium]|nr:hypothetical protein [Candidatus Curtissbacteria bacterium]